ncbi:MAG TPA: 16S rRNA (adenine(1518)-N(6)/adenine(1519)-N(6))-dimethyltransferase RsmA [Acidimicrobiales bacterium]|nr:16S rRNA (adenine(1518)-N(6)/adenine(1519)-N(6))-dimethyltransferase RsmA [Acidimicrobiales bacterium]
MAEGLGRGEVVRLLRDHGLHPSRALGQNFLVDPNTARRIVALAGVAAGDRVVEVGPGLGSLTVPLAAAGARVVAVEKDGRLADVLREVTDGLDVEVVEADAMRVDWGERLGTQPGWAMVSNPPYNVATPLVVTVLETAPQIDRLLVMVQKEVGERLAARPDEEAYGGVSVKVRYWADAAVVGRVPPTVFVPRPSVESALVAITRRSTPAFDPAVAPYRAITALVEAGFSQRRKMLRRSLAGVVSPEQFERAGVDPTGRAENLDVADWGRLAAARLP